MLSTILIALTSALPPHGPEALAVGPEAVFVALDEYKDLLKDAGDDSDKLWAVYEWTLEDDSRKKYRKRVLKKILRVDPDHRPTREALGHIEFDGKWFESERDRDKYAEKVAKERGLVKYDGRWVEANDIPYLERGWEKDPVTGLWFDPVAKQRIADGWKQQDLVWIEPDEIENIDKGLWKCGDEWMSLEEANAYHADVESPWIIPTERALIWSTANRETAMKAAEQAKNGYFDMLKVFGVAPETPVPFLVLRNQAEYLQFMDGSEEMDLPQVDPLAMSAFNRAAYADLWFDFDEEVYHGMGVTFWDDSGEGGDAFGIHDARFAYGLSFVDGLDPARAAVEDVLSEGEVSAEFLEAQLSEHTMPRWFRWGAACYASRWFFDNQIGKGGNPIWAREWSASNLRRNGGPLPFDEVFEFAASGQNPNTSLLLNQAGLFVAFLVDSEDPEVRKVRSALHDALEKREDTAKIFEDVRKALEEREEQVLAFMDETHQ
ncbi:MAG: hypothetical protein AAF726_00200 [Planctomycetota bacterium]